MFTRIIVGVDGSDGGRDALALAEELAGPDTEVLVAHAYPYGHHAVTRSLVGRDERLLRSDAERLLAATAQGHRVTTWALADRSPARALHELAECERGELLVVGSSHRGPVGRVLPGSVARAVLHGSPCPVAIAPRGHRGHAGGLRRIGVAYDDTPEAEAALAFADDLARDLNATLRLRTVVSAPVAYLGYTYAYDWSPFTAEQHRRAQARLDERMARLHVAAVGDVVEGPTEYELEDLAGQVDLLVAGSRGWGAVMRVVLGSTTDRLSHAAACPLLIVPAPAHSALEDQTARQDVMPAG